MKRLRGVVIGTLVALAVIGLVACGSKGETGIIWPKATSERTSAQPPKPVVWPLTGRAIAAGEDPSRRVISVKIENSSTARPQSGLQSADIVYETVVEGGIARFNALYQSKLPDPIGPVRSARLSDRYIVPQYHAIFLYSGSSGFVDAALSKIKYDNLSQDVGIGAPVYYRSSQRSAPHNLYVHLLKVYEVAEKRGIETTGTVGGLVFDQAVSSSAVSTPSVTAVNIPFSSANRVTWKYDQASKTYLRWNDGKVHTDALTGRQLSATNVVVIWAKYTEQSKVDAAGSRTYDITLTGSGRMTLFRNGQRYEGTWEMSSDAPPVLKDGTGIQLKLTPGNTWFEVINTSVNITLE